VRFAEFFLKFPEPRDVVERENGPDQQPFVVLHGQARNSELLSEVFGRGEQCGIGGRLDVGRRVIVAKKAIVGAEPGCKQFVAVTADGRFFFNARDFFGAAAPVEDTSVEVVRDDPLVEAVENVLKTCQPRQKRVVIAVGKEMAHRSLDAGGVSDQVGGFERIGNRYVPVDSHKSAGRHGTGGNRSKTDPDGQVKMVLTDCCKRYGGGMIDRNAKFGKERGPRQGQGQRFESGT